MAVIRNLDLDLQEFYADLSEGKSMKFFYGILAGLFFMLAVAGMVLPVLPTTPFLLLSSYFLIRVSHRWHARLLRMKAVGPILCDWQEHRGIRRAVRRKALAITVLAIGLSLFMTSLSALAACGLIFCGAIGITVIMQLQVIEDATNKESQRLDFPFGNAA